MKKNKMAAEETHKLLQNTLRLRRWLIIGGIATGLQALLKYFTQPESDGYIFSAILSIGCIAYGLSRTPRIRELSQTEKKAE